MSVESSQWKPRNQWRLLSSSTFMRREAFRPEVGPRPRGFFCSGPCVLFLQVDSLNWTFPNGARDLLLHSFKLPIYFFDLSHVHHKNFLPLPILMLIIWHWHETSSPAVLHVWGLGPRTLRRKHVNRLTPNVLSIAERFQAILSLIETVIGGKQVRRNYIILNIRNCTQNWTRLPQLSLEHETFIFTFSRSWLPSFRLITLWALQTFSQYPRRYLDWAASCYSDRPAFSSLAVWNPDTPSFLPSCISKDSKNLNHNSATWEGRANFDISWIEESHKRSNSAYIRTHHSNPKFLGTVALIKAEGTWKSEIKSVQRLVFCHQISVRHLISFLPSHSHCYSHMPPEDDDLAADTAAVLDNLRGLHADEVVHLADQLTGFEHYEEEFWVYHSFSMIKQYCLYCLSTTVRVAWAFMVLPTS